MPPGHVLGDVLWGFPTGGPTQDALERLYLLACQENPWYPLRGVRGGLRERGPGISAQTAGPVTWTWKSSGEWVDGCMDVYPPGSPNIGRKPPTQLLVHSWKKLSRQVAIIQLGSQAGNSDGSELHIIKERDLRLSLAAYAGWPHRTTSLQHGVENEPKRSTLGVPNGGMKLLRIARGRVGFAIRRES